MFSPEPASGDRRGLGLIGCSFQAAGEGQGGPRAAVSHPPHPVAPWLEQVQDWLEQVQDLTFGAFLLNSLPLEARWLAYCKPVLASEMGPRIMGML